MVRTWQRGAHSSPGAARTAGAAPRPDKDLGNRLGWRNHLLVWSLFMFESAQIGHAIDKEAYEAAVPALREALLEAQFELQQQARFPVVVLINGVEGAGKGETVKLLNEWMDPRLIQVNTFDQQTHQN